MGLRLLGSYMYSGLRLALQARFFLLAALCVASLCFVVLLVMLFGGREPGVVSLDVGISVVRLLVPLVAILLAQDLVAKEFDRKYYLLSMSYPAARWVMLVGRLMSIGVLVFGLMLIMLVALLGILMVEGQVTLSYDWLARYMLVGVFLAVDFAVVMAVSVFLSIAAVTPGFVLVGALGFLVLARSYSAVTALLNESAGLVYGQALYQHGLGFLSFMLPDLGALDVRAVVLYGRIDFLPADWPWFVFSALIYAVAVVIGAIALLNQKKF